MEEASAQILLTQHLLTTAVANSAIYVPVMVQMV
jgi:hypothetical protein